MDVTDDVEGPVLVTFVVPQWYALEGGRFDLFGARQEVNVPEPLALERLQRTAELTLLLSDNSGAEVAVWAGLIARHTELGRYVQDDGDRDRVVLTGQGNERLARILLHVGRVHDREQTAAQTRAHDVVQHIEGVVRRRLVILVVGDEPAAVVGRDDLGRLEVLACEGRFAGTRRPYEHDQRQFGDLECHRVNTPICVGAPTSPSTLPMGANRTP